MALVLDGTNKITATELADDAVTTAKIADSAITDALLPAGSVLQIKHAEYTATTSSSSDAYVDIPSLSVTLTPSSASSKFFIAVHVTIGGSGSLSTILRVVRNGSGFFQGDSVGNRQTSQTTVYTNSQSHANNGAILLTDEPNSTDAQTYKVQYHSQNANTSAVNRNTEFGNDANEYNAVFTSTISVMEIAG